MKHILFVLLVAFSVNTFAQLTVDTTRTTITVKEKTGNNIRTLTVYKSYVEGVGIRNQLVYQPVAEDFGEESEILRLELSAELPHLKKMLDAAMKIRKLDCSRLSINILPYTDLVTRLTNIYESSQEWNDYLKKATNLRITTTLFDGSEVSEVAYDTRIATAVLDKSNFVKELSDFFAQYSYTVQYGGFPDEHQQPLSTDKLQMIGKNGNLFIPVPNHFFTLTKIK